MRKTLLLAVLLAISSISLLLSLLYFSNPQYRKEKIENYKEKVEKRRHRAE